MTERLEFAFEEVAATDVPELTRIMALAFADDYRRCSASDQPALPGYVNADFFHAWPHGCIDCAGYKITAAGTIIGGIVIWMFDDGQNTLGMIFVDPAYQNYGVGSRTWQFIERTYPETRSWTLATPDWSIKNRYFYETVCGFTLAGQAGDHVVYRKDV